MKLIKFKKFEGDKIWFEKEDKTLFSVPVYAVDSLELLDNYENYTYYIEKCEISSSGRAQDFQS